MRPGAPEGSSMCSLTKSVRLPTRLHRDGLVEQLKRLVILDAEPSPERISVRRKSIEKLDSRLAPQTFFLRSASSLPNPAKSAGIERIRSATTKNLVGGCWASRNQKTCARVTSVS